MPVEDGLQSGLQWILVRLVIELDGFDLDGPFEHVQLRPDREGFKGVGLGAHLAGQQTVAGAGRMAGPHQQLAGLREPHAANDLVAQGLQRIHMHQQHALARQPDAPIGVREAQQFAKIQVGWKRGQGIAGHGSPLYLIVHARAMSR